MNSKAKIVLWLGFAMLAFQIFVAWPAIKAIVFAKVSSNPALGVPGGQLAPGVTIPPLLQPFGGLLTTSSTPTTPTTPSAGK